MGENGRRSILSSLNDGQVVQVARALEPRCHELIDHLAEVAPFPTSLHAALSRVFFLRQRVISLYAGSLRLGEGHGVNRSSHA